MSVVFRAYLVEGGSTDEGIRLPVLTRSGITTVNMVTSSQ